MSAVPPTGRRRRPWRDTALLSLALPGAVAAVVAAPVATAPGRTLAPPAPVAARVQTVAVADEVAAATGAPTPTRRFSAVGVTWRPGRGTGPVTVQVRTRDARTRHWTGWTDVEVEGDDAPDAGTAEARDPRHRAGTMPLWAGPSDGVQTRVRTATGHPLRDVRVALIDPGSSPADGQLGAKPATPRDTAEAGAPARPRIITRRQWGADERLSRGGSGVAPRVLMGFVHHTASTNRYTAATAAQQVRAMYAYHTRSRGYSDIGYNFLVDKYGRLYEGRAGGVDRAVVGAHTGGFNTGTFAVSMLGDYSSVTPPAAVTEAISRLFAWKLAEAHRDPLARTTLRSAGGGTSRYAAGRSASFRGISGHRDAGFTACPGARAYALVPTIRARVARLVGTALYDPSLSAPVVDVTRPVPVELRARPSRAVSWTLSVTEVATGTTVRTVRGTAGGEFAATWDLARDDGRRATAGAYRLRLTASGGGDRAVPVEADVTLVAPLPSGIVVRSPDGYAVLRGGHLVTPSAALLSATRHRGTAVAVASANLAGLPGDAVRPPDGSLWRAEDGTRFVVTAGERRALTQDTAAALGLASDPPVMASSTATLVTAGPVWTATDRHPEGMLVTEGERVWRLEGGLRRPLTSAGAVDSWRAVASAPALPGDLVRAEGPPLGPAEGTLLRLPDGTAAVVGGGSLLPLSDGVLLALGWSAATALVAVDADVAALPVGPALDGDAHPSGTRLQGPDGVTEVVGAARRRVPDLLVGTDPRPVLQALPGELERLRPAGAAAPEGLVGRGADGTLRVASGGRVLVLGGAAAAAYPSDRIASLEVPDLGLGESLPVDVVTQHPAGTLVTDGAAVWRVSGGERRPVAASLLGTWAGFPVLPALPGDLLLPVGAAAAPQPGVVVTADGTRWVVDDGVRRRVSAEVAAATGLAAVVAVAVDEAELVAATVEGEPLG